MVETIWWNPRMKSITWMSLAMCIGIQPLWTTLFSTMYFLKILPMFWNFIILINIIHIIEFHPFNQFHQCCHLPLFIKFHFHMCVFSTMWWISWPYIHPYSITVLFCGKFSQLGNSQCNFYGGFFAEKMTQSQISRKRSVSSFTKLFFIEKIKWGCLIHVPCAKNLSYSIYHRTWTWF